MRKLSVFNNVTLDGFFAGPDGDFSWAHKAEKDSEYDAFIAGNARSGGTLLFGRITYEIMAGYWPTPMAMANDPVVAEGINNRPKVVFSRTLEHASWNNTRLVKGDLTAEIRKMKGGPGKGIAILGSGSLVAQLAKLGLIDEYQFMVNPVVLGRGRTLFEGLTEKLPLRLIKSRNFGNGNVLLCYEPAA